MGYIDEHFFKKAFSEESKIKKFVYYSLAVFALVVLAHIVGYVGRKGATDFENSSGPFVTIKNGFSLILTYVADGSKKNINIILAILLIFLAFIIGKYFEGLKDLFKIISSWLKNIYIRKQLIFEDDFSVIKEKWHLRYWEENNPDKNINRIEYSTMIFEAEESQIANHEKKFGAYYDFDSLSEGDEYEVVCWVKSIPDSTMKFQVWLHDNIMGGRSIWSARMPKYPIIPSLRYQKISVKFIATTRKALRIHLEATPGLGKILVRRVKLLKYLKY
ncbi:MAG: hypothetical protein PHP25_02210 [Candidatus Moranbacteria bacterium]|nr:hypothetical protein [Candidatus Moranbacteria bacterium]